MGPAGDDAWPLLPLAAWRDTYETLHRYLQIIGKVQLALTPRMNHWWNVAFHPTARGLATPPLDASRRPFTVDMDFVAHEITVRMGDGPVRAIALRPRTVRDFYRDFMGLLGELGVPAHVWDHPVEIRTETIPFHEDTTHASYDPDAVGRWWRIVSQSAALFQQFRARFVGKASPVDFYWGSFDLCVSRYSGRRAPVAPDADVITREAYSHEVSEAGFWPGDERYPAPAYFAYTVPKPAGLEAAPVRPAGARWHPDLGLHLLPYEAVRRSDAPGDLVLELCQSCYEAGANLAGWDRAALERPAEPGAPAAAPGAPVARGEGEGAGEERPGHPRPA